MGIDVGRFLRLRGAIDGALAATPSDQAGISGEALPAAYSRLRAAALELLAPADHAEFADLFPEDPLTQRRYTGGSRYPLETANRANEARAILGALSGWLGGFVEEVRMQREAEAYAQARVKAERGVGFRAEDQSP